MITEAVVSKFSRWEKRFEAATGIEKVQIITPSGEQIFRPVFDFQPVTFHYDFHGYEEMRPAGNIVKMVRFTPLEEGVYHFLALHSDQVAEKGMFEAAPSDHSGFVVISRKDPRYFACSNGDSYCPIGLNLCAPSMYSLPLGLDHFAAGEQKATLGLHEYRRWFRLLAENGGNFTRIWLSNAYLEAETSQAGEVDLIKFNRLDGIVELAREYGIRLKLCFDHFRAFSSTHPVTSAYFLKKLVNPKTGSEPRDMDDWLSDPAWQDLWFKKVNAYLDRYGGDPVVMAWELWNEMDCVETNHWELVRDWTRKMLIRIKEVDPNHLVVNSLGSFDENRKQIVQEDLKMDENDFQQVHRYLDQGAPLEICRLDPVAFSVDAIHRARRLDRPVLLAETGAVNDRHTGPFRYFRMDHRGMIFHDTTFPAFFAGGAGTGQNWFWGEYADTQNVWGQFKPFGELLKGVMVDEEGFQSLDCSNELAWCLALIGKRIKLLWIRNRADRWDAVLRDEIAPPVLGTLVFDLRLGKVENGQLFVFPAWPMLDLNVQASFHEGKLAVSNLQYGVMVRIN